MSTYLDPATALTIARAARAEEIRAAEEHRLAHPRSSRRSGRTWRVRWHPAWHRPALAG
jgi:hypothetical protein